MNTIEQIIFGLHDTSIVNISMDAESYQQLTQLKEKGYYVNYLDEEQEIKSWDDFWNIAVPRLRVGYGGRSLDALYDVMTTLKIPKKKAGVILFWNKPTGLQESAPEFYEAVLNLISSVDERWKPTNKRILLVLGDGRLPFHPAAKTEPVKKEEKHFTKKQNRSESSNGESSLHEIVNRLVDGIRESGLNANYIVIHDDKNEELFLSDNPRNPQELKRMFESMLAIYPNQHGVRIIADKQKGMNNPSAIILSIDHNNEGVITDIPLKIEFEKTNALALSWIDKLAVVLNLNELPSS